MKPTRLRGFSDAYGSWKIIIISRLIGRISAWLIVVMSRPSNVIVPPVGSSRRMMHRAIVDLPQPDSPTTPSVSPRLTREGDVVHRLHRGDLLLEDDPARDREVLLQVLDAEQLVGHGISCASHLRRRSSAVCSFGLTLLGLLVEEARLEVVRVAGHRIELGLARPCSGRRRTRSAG